MDNHSASKPEDMVSTEIGRASPGPGVVEDLTKAQARRLVLKTDLVVTPLAVLAMTLAFLDKNALGYAAVFGIRDDANLKGQDYSWLSSIFYFGYLAMEFPNLWLMTKVPIGKYIGVCLTLWGISLCFMGLCHNFAGLATIRFLLGVFEAAVLPCMMLLNSMWYRKEEQPLRTAFWYNTFAGVFGGILSYAIGKINGSLPTWKYIFIIYGSITIFIGVLIFFVLPDSPSKAWFFTDQEKRLALVRLAENQTGVETHQRFNAKQVFEALRDPKCWCIWLCALGYAVVNAGVTNFNPLIIAGYGFSQTKTVLMATPQAAVAMVAGATLTAITFWVPNMRCIFWIIASLIGMGGAIMVHLLNVDTHRDASLAGVYLMGFYNVPWVFMLSLSSTNTAGATKKSFMGVSIAVVYAVGNIVGPQFFLQEQAPRYPLGIGSMLCAFAMMAAAGIAYYALCVVENKRRDAQYGKPQDVVQHGLEVNRSDETDKQNHTFRYTY
ncbi:major facilitator superfamily domain-containing protein [Emericellopsis atlantica]|uniref:Major facilitator superfamily domain-containing protein n=1 Tax=Emericellopsis atlantica TaxID=2614577 RepID=A0A9P7ZRR7_9HYPO|nr:major facilitator superfamily domain-containing protein [Emericellopsis atlantica]KAG9256611.1 major facilitator superfamily domain-containing protein [Emericellopsis atlantica]